LNTNDIAQFELFLHWLEAQIIMLTLAVESNGIPKNKWLSDVTEEMLEEKLKDPKFREQYKDSLWKKLLAQGVVSAMTLDKIWERTEGKVTQTVDVNGTLNISISERMRKAKERKLNHNG
jgi:hypothetical protein